MCSVIKKLNRMQKAFLLVEKKTLKISTSIKLFRKKISKRHLGRMVLGKYNWSR
jgi:hypothetical protein